MPAGRAKPAKEASAAAATAINPSATGSDLTRATSPTLRDTGRHTRWGCPCLQHTADVPRHRDISPGVVRDIIKRMECLPEGWLQ